MFRWLRSIRQRRAARQALRWVVRLDSDVCNADERLALERWLAVSDERRQEFARAQQLHTALQHWSVNAPAPALSHMEETRHPWPYWALGSCVATLLLFLLINSQGIVKTGVAQHSVVALADGSRIEMNADSRVRVTETETLRQVELLQGEAYFSVEHDAARPLVVLVNGQRITDIGTQFNVRARGGVTRVGVLEGEVAIDRQAHWGQSDQEPRHVLSARQLTQCVEHCSAAQNVDEQTLERETAWRRRQLVIDNRPLTEVVEELNHYTHYKLVLLSERNAQRAIGGVFYLDDPEAVLRVLGKTTGLRRVQITPYLVVLRDQQD